MLGSGAIIHLAVLPWMRAETSSIEASFFKKSDLLLVFAAGPQCGSVAHEASLTASGVQCSLLSARPESSGLCMLGQSLDSGCGFCGALGRQAFGVIANLDFCLFQGHGS